MCASSYLTTISIYILFRQTSCVIFHIVNHQVKIHIFVSYLQ